MKSSSDEINLPAPADFHVHVRQGAMSEMVCPHVAQGGIRTAYVMPNTIPPITSTAAALAYRDTLQRISPETEWLMTLYLHPDITPDEVRKAAKAGIRGESAVIVSDQVISPRGDDQLVRRDRGLRGVLPRLQGDGGGGDGAQPAWRGAERCCEGELPTQTYRHSGTCGSSSQNISVLNAEKHFLAHLRKLATDFPKLRIVLEHATTADAIECVASLPSTVACTITAHHLYLTIDDVAPQPHHYCKPIAKEPRDRSALQSAILSGNPRFFLGSDSAPHPSASKAPAIKAIDLPPTPCAAGVYTSPILIPLVATLLEGFGGLERLEGFVRRFGREFYGVPAAEGKAIRIRRSTGGKKVGSLLKGEEGVEVVPFWAGKELGWEIA